VKIHPVPVRHEKPPARLVQDLGIIGQTRVLGNNRERHEIDQIFVQLVLRKRFGTAAQDQARKDRENTGKWRTMESHKPSLLKIRHSPAPFSD
jgi:hypothetical protein